MLKQLGKKSLIVALVVMLMIGIAYVLARRQVQTSAQVTQPTSSNQGTYNPAAPTKTAGCVAVGALPDPACTPGAVITTATKDQICVSGYSSTVRNVPVSEKNAVYAAYGIANHTPGEYEVDHLISLELGGSNDIANLWPEASSPTPGFHQKDEYENKLHSEVCAGTLSLAEAQNEVATKWLQFYLAR